LVGTADIGTPFHQYEYWAGAARTMAHHTAQCFQLTVFNRRFARQQLRRAFQSFFLAGCRKTLVRALPHDYSCIIPTELLQRKFHFAVPWLP
jgi:hypothetical protein